jgi:hypothetical protein
MESPLQNFEEAVLPHLGAVYNLARWLTHNDTEAEEWCRKLTSALSGTSAAFMVATAGPGCSQ